MNSDAVEIDVTFRLYGESSFWLFSRISVKNCTFDEHSAIIKIHKMENSVKSFLSMGTLVNINNELKVKTFLRQQLINFNKKKDLKHLEQNFCQYRLLIIDGGEENIYCKVYCIEA